MRRAITRAGAAAGLAVLLVLTAAWEAPITQARRLIKEYVPAQFHQSPTGAEPKGPLRPLRVRLHADAECRAGVLDPKSRFRILLARVNAFANPGFNIDFQLVDYRKWESHNQGARLDAQLAELVALDPGTDVDLVVGCTSPLQLESQSSHEAGRAVILGKHFVLRPLTDVGEEKAFREAFHMMDESERASVIEARRAHKSVAFFLHEWAHTLGGLHEREPSWLLHPLWTDKQGAFSYINTRTMEIALRHRLEGPYDAVAEAKEMLDFLRGFHEEWSEQDRAWLLGALEKRAAGQTRLGAPTGETHDGAAAPVSWKPEDVATFNRAVSAYNAHTPELAWTTLKPLVERLSSEPRVQGLACRLASLKEAEARGRAGCDWVLAHASGMTDPEPLLDVAEGMMRVDRFDDALGALATATKRARESATTSPVMWQRVAEMDLQLGALTAGVEALTHAPEDSRAQSAARFALERSRVGLPAGTSDVAPDMEPIFVHKFWDVARLLAERKTAAAEQALAHMAMFSRTGGYLCLSCEVALQRGQPQARSRCDQALRVDPDAVRAHVALGFMDAFAGKWASAQSHDQRALELDPENKRVWTDLAAVYKHVHRNADLDTLKQRYADRFHEDLLGAHEGDAVTGGATTARAH